MVKNLTQALQLIQNSLSTKLHKQKVIETFLESISAIDSEFLIFKDRYLPVAPRNSRIFQILENEQFFSACSLSEGMKIYRQIVKFKRAMPASTTFKILSNKFVHSDIEKIDFRSEYYRPIKHCSTMHFLLTPAPQGKIVNCKVRKGQGVY